MCVYSMIVDHFGDKWDRRVDPWREASPYRQPITEPTFPPVPKPTITPEEIAEFKELLKRAREYDKKNQEPDCELEEKKERIRKLAEELGVKIEFE